MADVVARRSPSGPVGRRVARLVALSVVGVLALLSAPAPALAASVDLGAFSGPVRFEAPDGTTLAFRDRRYVGTIEVLLGADGVTVVDELTTDAYLEGLAEVPVSWPEATLRAQVVAARTYVWWEVQEGIWTDRGYDVCATQACQVFAGRDVVEAPSGARWAAAVAATSGEVLVDGSGDPLLARYSSTNGGRSRASGEVFPDDGDQSYLQPVDDPHDAVSPWHRWQVVFPRTDLDEILARGETLSAAVPLADIRLVEIDGGEDLVEVTGQDGTVASVTASQFRFFVADTAPQVDPAAYPPPRSDGSGRLPATLLSSQLTFSVFDDRVVVDGRGFGHGVGMSQYGALGKAEAGFTYPEILADYYGGISPSQPDALPERLRVGLAEGAEEAAVTPDGPVRIVVGDTELTERGLGTWQVRTRPDRTVQLFAPEGYGAPLVVDPTTVDRTTPWATEVVELETVVNKHVELAVEVRGADGELVTTQSAGIAPPGRQTREWSLEGPDVPLLAPGDYEVALVATDEAGDRAGTPVPLTVRAPVTSATTAVLGPAPATPTRLDQPLSLLPPLLVGGALGAAVALGLARRRTT